MKKTKAELKSMANYISAQEGQYLFSASEISKILGVCKDTTREICKTLSLQPLVESSVILLLIYLNLCTIKINKKSLYISWTCTSLCGNVVTATEQQIKIWRLNLCMNYTIRTEISSVIA